MLLVYFFPLSRIDHLGRKSFVVLFAWWFIVIVCPADVNFGVAISLNGFSPDSGGTLIFFCPYSTDLRCYCFFFLRNRSLIGTFKIILPFSFIKFCGLYLFPVFGTAFIVIWQFFLCNLGYSQLFSSFIISGVLFWNFKHSEILKILLDFLKGNKERL